MIEKSLNQLFAVVSAEAGRNRQFADRLEDAVLSMADSLSKSREIDEQVRQFNPFQVFNQEGATGIEAALKNRSYIVLRQMVERHNADPSGQLGSKPRKSDLIASLVAVAEKRAARDARLFQY